MLSYGESWETDGRSPVRVGECTTPIDSRSRRIRVSRRVARYPHGLEAQTQVGHPQSIRRSRGSLRFPPEPSPDPKTRGDLRRGAKATSALLKELHTRYPLPEKPCGSSCAVSLRYAAEPRAVGRLSNNRDARRIPPHNHREYRALDWISAHGLFPVRSGPSTGRPVAPVALFHTGNARRGSVCLHRANPES